MRATNNDKYNDSAFAQFSDAVTSTGAPLFRIGTTEAFTLNLQTSKNAKLNGWGWVGSAYWLTQPATISFSGTGVHSLRIQTREDGLQIDQVVISPATYLSAAPGQKSGDSTIIAKPPTTPTPTPTPYSGTAVALPGTWQAEDFDNGGEGLAYHDADAANSGSVYRQTGVDLEAASEGGYDVGWISPGEWLAYTVNVKAAGNYLIEARVAAPSQGGTFHVEFGGVNVTGSSRFRPPAHGRHGSTISKAVALSAGVQTAKVVFDTAGPSALGNLDWLRVSTAIVTPPTRTPYSGTAVALPGAIAGGPIR